MSELVFSEAELAQARRIYRGLAFLPRFRGNAFTVAFIQTLLALHAPPGNLRLRARGFRVEHRTVRALDRTARVRIVHPPGPSRGILFDIHGGGWVIGIPGQNDALNMDIARAHGLTIVSADYRLFRPRRISISACVDDCETAAHWLLETAGVELGFGPIVVSGDSAGAHLATSTLLRLRDRGGPFHKIKAAILRYGVYDFAGTPSVHAAGSKTLVLDGPGLRRGLAMLTPGLDDAGRRDPSLSPLYADLRGLPPALLIAGDADALRDDSVLLRERWNEAGSSAELVLVPEAPHAFDRLPTRVAGKVAEHVRRWVAGRLEA